MATDFSNAWLAEDPRNVREFYHKVDMDNPNLEENVAEMLSALDKSHVRVVVLNGHTHDVEEIMRLVDKLDIADTASDTVWMMTADSIPKLQNLNTLKNGAFSIVSKLPSTNESLAYAKEWQAQGRTDADNDWATLDDFGWHVHDAVIAIATAVDRMTQGDSTNQTGSLPFVWNAASPLEVRRELQRQLEATNFSGVSGHVRFNGLHDRASPLFSMYNLQGENFVPVATVVEDSNDWARVPDVWPIFPDGTRNMPTDYIPADFLWLVKLCATALVCGCVLYLWKRRQFRRKSARLNGALEATKAELEAMSQKLASRMTSMYTVIYDIDPDAVFDLKPLKSDQKKSKKSKKSSRGDEKFINPIADSEADEVQWCWEEDEDNVNKHNAFMIIKGTNFIHYSNSVNQELEDAYQLYKMRNNCVAVTIDLENRISSTGTEQKLINRDTGTVFSFNFDSMMQTNVQSGFQRKMLRQENRHTAIHISDEPTLDLKTLPPLPSDINFGGEDGQSLLHARRGQIVQVAKEHSNGQWLYGNVLHDPTYADHAAHAEGDSGWFPRLIVDVATAADMQVLAGAMGSTAIDALDTPWPIEGPPSNKVRVVAVTDSAERSKVEKAFMQSLSSKIKIKNIERVENLPMWQSYAVKKQTTTMRDQMPDHTRLNNHGKLERRWLFHGTSSETVPLITQQGFNRAFAGKNATYFGKGVYFAVNSSYSANTTYSPPDKNKLQRMFMCRVVVGDWCAGKSGALTPDTKPNSLELFDTTVDSICEPSIFVAYHDAQAYPEYIVSFKK